MKLAGFNFKKIDIEKFSDDFKNLKINTNIEILDVMELKQDLFKSKEQFLGIDFKFDIKYEPEIARIEFKGKMLFSVDQKKAKAILKEWEEKKIEPEFRLFLFNIIMRKSNVKALELEEQMNLPFHINLPIIRPDSGSSETKK